MLPHFTIETDREVDSTELLSLLLGALPTSAMRCQGVAGWYVDRDAAAAERAIAKRDRAIRLLLDEWVEQDEMLDSTRHLVDYLTRGVPGFPADVVDTIRHACGIDTPVEVES